MEKDVKKNEIPACDDFSLMSGQIARNELQHSNTETTEILSAHKNIFTQIRKGDVLLHHPYESFDPIVAFIRQAAEDLSLIHI